MGEVICIFVVVLQGAVYTGVNRALPPPVPEVPIGDVVSLSLIHLQEKMGVWGGCKDAVCSPYLQHTHGLCIIVQDM